LDFSRQFFINSSISNSTEVRQVIRADRRT
jgi:hypothetical protein